MSPIDIEIIIPVLPAEDKLRGLLDIISSWPVRISLSIGQPSPHQQGMAISHDDAKKILNNTPFDPLWDHNKLQWISAPQGRARQLNSASQLSPAKFFWFLHADSYLDDDALRKVLTFAEQAPDSIGYGRLFFDRDGPLLCHLNAIGANFRSSVFKMPFEDQGLFISKENFRKLGGFSTSVPYGEGHDLIWRAKAYGLSLRPIGYKITTSSRRYRHQGWLATTTRFFYLTWKQALPYMIQSIFSKTKKTTAVAVFVKTPGLSHMKTRLSRSIGLKEAENFQRQALSEISKTLGGLKNVTIYWAISEADAYYFKEWRSFSRIIQSDGDLGDKIHHVYSKLITQFGRVILIGSDAPQISKAHFEKASTYLDAQDYVIGPASDGGFWLFGGKEPLERRVWKSTPWSDPDTFHKLCESLPSTPAFLETLTDVDTVDDIAEMLKEGVDLSLKLRETCQRLLQKQGFKDTSHSADIVS